MYKRIKRPHNFQIIARGFAKLFPQDLYTTQLSRTINRQRQLISSILPIKLIKHASKIDRIAQKSI